MGRPAGRRRRAGERGRAPRDRSRRGADHDDPRRQGPGVPDRGGRRAHHPAPRRPGRRRRALDTRRPRGPPQPDASSPGSTRPPRCSTSSSTSTSGAGCSTSPAPGRETTSSCRSTARHRGPHAPVAGRADRRRHHRSRPPRGCWPSAGARRLGAVAPRRRRLGRGSPAAADSPAGAAGADRHPTPTPAVDPARWRAEHTLMLAGAGRPRTMAATSFAAHLDPEPRALDDPGLAKGAVDLDLPPWQKGRYGTAIGRAVHAVLQTVDLATGAGLDDAAAAQAAAEGVIGREGTIAALARSALATDRSAPRPPSPGCWREVFVAAPVRRHDAGGLRRSALPLTRGPRRGRLQDRPAAPARPSSTSAPLATGCQLAAYALAVRARHGRGGGPGDAGVLLRSGGGDGASGS